MSFERALTANRSVLLEHELLDRFEALGLKTPERRYLTLDSDFSDGLKGFTPKRAVLKVVSEHILHKSDVGGVVLLKEFSLEALKQATETMLAGLPSDLRSSVSGVLVEEAIDFESKLGHELLIGMRDTPDFGPVYTIGFGGTYVEALAQASKDNQSTILYKPGLTSKEQFEAKLEKSLFFKWISGKIRGVDALCKKDELLAVIHQTIDAIETIRKEVEEAGRRLIELELNPMVFAKGHGFLPVDALGRLGELKSQTRKFPIDNLRKGIRPESIALIGVSTKMNMGRIILRSVLDAGFDAKDIFVIREGCDEIDGVRCVPNVSSLPKQVDLMVLAVPATAVVEVLNEVYQSQKVKAVLLIPGGMGETEGGKEIAKQVDDLLAANRDNPERAVLIGNNSVGLVSNQVKLDTLFIPKDKLPRNSEGVPNIAIISQSGAFMLTQIGKLDFAAPDYQLSIGNQVDARISDFVEALADEKALSTYALYIEGLKPEDGEPLAKAIAKLKRLGKDAIVYKAGRSGLGQAATMGHTASVAGDYRVFGEMLKDAGAIVVERFEEFCDMVKLSSMLHQKRVEQKRVAITSNAGYETVGMADNHHGEAFSLAPAKFSQKTAEKIQTILKEAKIDALVNVTNPLDLTPMANDHVHAECLKAILDDPEIDCGVFGMVPFTPAVQTLPKGISERDVFDAEKGFCAKMIQLSKESTKPFVIVVDGGSHYDQMCQYLQANGVVVFRQGDDAIAGLGRYLETQVNR